MCDLKITLAADSFVLSGVWTPVVALFTQFVDNSLCQFTRFVDQVQIRRILDVYRCRRSGFTSCFSLLHDRSDQEFPWSARPRVLYGHSTLLLLDHGFWSVGHTLTATSSQGTRSAIFTQRFSGFRRPAKYRPISGNSLFWHVFRYISFSLLHGFSHFSGIRYCIIRTFSAVIH